MNYFKILIISTEGPGKTMLATPFLQALKDALPGGMVDAIVADTDSSAILRANKLCGDIFSADSGVFNTLRLAQRARNRHYTHSITLYSCNTPRANLLAFLSGATTRIAHSKGANSSALSFLINSPMPERAGIHAIRQNLNFISVFDPLFQIKTDKPFLNLDTTALSLAEKFIQENRLSNNFLTAVYPGADSPLLRATPDVRWPVKSYTLLCDMLVKEKNSRVILLPSLDGDTTECDAITATAMKSKNLFVFPENSISAAAALISKCGLFIANDTVLAHAACSTRVPSVCMFGPTDPALTGPVGSNAYILQNDESCPVCAGHRKETKHTCLAGIAPNTVWKTIETILS